MRALRRRNGRPPMQPFAKVREAEDATLCYAPTMENPPMTTLPLPLNDFLVIDLTAHRAGPTAVRQLADWGAQVIKIEPSGELVDATGSRRDGPDFQNLHRNKRAMTLNLNSDEGTAIFFKLAGRADVIVENYKSDDDVGAPGELEEDRAAFVAFQIQCHRPLIAVQVLEVGPVAAAAGGVDEFAGGFDLDDLGAPIGKLAHRRRAGAMRGQVDDEKIVQGQR